MRKLPLPVNETPKPSVQGTTDTPVGTDKNLRIAWRYNNLEKVDSTQGSSTSHYFDLSQHIDNGTLDTLNIDYFDGNNAKAVQHTSTNFHQQSFVELLQSLATKLKDAAFTTSTDETNNLSTKNLLRVVLKSLGSPLWWNDNFSNDLCLFLVALKALIRNTLSVCCITMPSHLFKYFVSILNRNSHAVILIFECLFDYLPHFAFFLGRQFDSSRTQFG